MMIQVMLKGALIGMPLVLLSVVLYATGSESAGTGADSQPTSRPASQPAGPVRVVMETSLGEVVIELDPVKAPGTAKSFLEYVDAGFYDGTVFHRVIANFMIQGGGFGDDLKQKPTRGPIKNEAKNGLKNERGTIAMARQRDPHSATSQFFINVADNRPLDYPSRDGWGYCVFGRVVKGLDVVDKIRQVPTGRASGQLLPQSWGKDLKYVDAPLGDVPKEPVVVRSIRRQ